MYRQQVKKNEKYHNAKLTIENNRHDLMILSLINKGNSNLVFTIDLKKNNEQIERGITKGIMNT